MFTTLVLLLIVWFYSDFGIDITPLVDSDVLVVLLYKGNFFGLRATPGITLDKVFTLCVISGRSKSTYS